VSWYLIKPRGNLTFTLRSFLHMPPEQLTTHSGLLGVLVEAVDIY
jgi:hypothetical protein